MKTHPGKLLSGYVDGELSQWRRARVERHLDRCAACRAEVDALREIKAAVAATKPAEPMETVSEFFWAQVRQRLAREDDRSAVAPGWLGGVFPWRNMRVVLVAVTAVVVVAVGILFFQHHRLPSGPEAFVKIDEVSTNVPNAEVRVEQSSAAGVPVISLPESYVKVEEVSTPLPEATVSAFHSSVAGVTVIWMSGLRTADNENNPKDM